MMVMELPVDAAHPLPYAARTTPTMCWSRSSPCSGRQAENQSRGRPVVHQWRPV